MTGGRRYLIAQLAFTVGICLPHLSLAQDAASTDSVAAMCLDRSEVDVCRCASDALLIEVGPDDYALYDRIGAAYLEHRAAGLELADAWDAALAPIAADLGLGTSGLMSRTNDIGRAHRNAIRDCQG